MLKLEALTKTYGKNSRPAVDNLSLEIQPGEIFGFIGANGAGKTTTIKMMTGILKPDAGHTWVFGSNMQDDTIAAKRKIGYVPDNHELYERLTGMEYLNFLADVYEVDTEDRQERIKTFLNMFALEDNISDPIKSYSHGMKQKICIIGALLHKPPVWILDEPLTGLDPQSSFRLKEVMRAHCDAGNIVFFSTHVLDVAERLCDRVGIIQSGKLLAVGTPKELRAREGETLEEVFLTLVGE